MKEMTTTELARHFREALDEVEFKGEEIVLIRNHHQVARILPGLSHQTALEAMSNLYCTLPDKAAATWIDDSCKFSSRKSRLSRRRNPWDS